MKYLIGENVKNKEEEYKKNITLIEILAIVITLILVLFIGSKNLNVISYEITYNGINCPTPYVVFYSNGKYDYYEFYMWISDSFQEEDLSNYNGEEEQNDLIGKRIKGKIEVELYGEEKSALVRTPSEELNTETCMIENITTEEVIPS